MLYVAIFRNTWKATNTINNQLIFLSLSWIEIRSLPDGIWDLLVSQEMRIIRIVGAYTMHKSLSVKMQSIEEVKDC